MSLEEYRRKRDFTKTGEPKGRVQHGKPDALRFVVQKHAASHLHYDFRLEMQGVLRSWAVPKGPSLDPGVKRLAMHVEDHPLDYGGFEGVIPEGQYGGGTVMIWDQGDWEPEGDPVTAYEQGALKFVLQGKRLKGRWMLAQMRGERHAKSWLLIKERDRFARPGSAAELVEKNQRSVVSRRTMDGIAKARDRVWQSNRPGKSQPALSAGESVREAPAPAARTPHRPAALVAAATIPGARRAAMPAKPGLQLATLTAVAPSGEEWLHEIKYDGYRMMARLARGDVRMISRNGNDWTAKFPTLVAALETLPARSAILDGEVVHLRQDGVSSFSDLQADLSEHRSGRMVYVAFDLLYLDGYLLTPARLEDRKAALAALLGGRKSGPVRYSEHIDGNGNAFQETACEHRLEGIVSKRRDAPYRAGRWSTWLKSKCLGREEFAIIGWTDPGGARHGLGSLLLGYHGGEGALHYAGRVGTGFNDKTLHELRRRLEPLALGTSPFPTRIPDVPRGAHWVRPELVAEIRFSEWTADRRLRHASYLGLREDKAGKDVVRAPALGAGLAAGQPARPARAAASRDDRVGGVRLTHPGRVLYPELGLTKLDLARYYETVADRMLPHLRGRPLTLVRCPEGRGAPCFYQKHDEHAPEPLRRIEVTEKDGSRETYLIADDLAGLVALAQMGVLEIHVWGARRPHLEEPDRLVMDLDPDEGLPWQRVTEAALLIRSLFDQLGLRSFVKATGGKGLHVVVPFRPQQAWDAVKRFAKAIAEALVLHDPASFTASMAKKHRTGKIFVDYLRNQRGATAIAPYSVRARPGAPVAMPLSWAEIEAGVRSDQFTLSTIAQRLASVREDPWAEMEAIKQDLPRDLAGPLRAASSRRAADRRP